MDVYYHKLPISSISKEIQDDEFVHEHTMQEVKNQIKGYINY